MSRFPWPRPVFSNRGRSFIPAVCGLGIVGEPQSPGFVASGMWVPGGVLAPADLYGAQILGLKRLGLATNFIVAVAGGGRPQNFFSSVIAPGINGGQALHTADATVLTSAYGATAFTYWQWDGLPAGEPVAGDVIFT